MAPKPLPLDQAQAWWAVYQKAVAEGHPGVGFPQIFDAYGNQTQTAARVACDALGIKSKPIAYVSVVERSFRLHGVKPRLRVPISTRAVEPTAELATYPKQIVRVTVMPDAHDCPGLNDKSRFEWIGKHVAETAPDFFVDIGDSADMDSVSFHTGNGTLGGKLKPSFLEDCASYNKACDLLYGPMGRVKTKRKKKRGNHENRLWRFEEMNPEVAGMMQNEYACVLDNHDVEELPYGEYLNIAGVDFVHIPLTKMAKPRGGENAANIIGNKSVRDVVIGHTHNAQVRTATKDGQNERVRVFETGTALPWGHVAKYAEHVHTGWWWGIVDLTIADGRVEGWNYIPMFELQRRYG